MRNVKKLLKYLFEYSLNEFSFFDSPDEDKPGNYQYLTFNSSDIYPIIQGYTHGLTSHTIKHLDEFMPDAVTSAVNQAISIYNQDPNVILKSAKNNTEIGRGAAAVNAVQKGTILNSFDLINDKIKNNETLAPTENQVLGVMQNLNSTYENLIQQYMNQAVDADHINDANEIRELINNKRIVKFSGSYKGYPKTYYINFANSGLVAAEGDQVSTLFRVDKRGADLEKIKKYFSRDMYVNNPAFREALGIASQSEPSTPESETPATPTNANQPIVSENLIFVRRWQILANIVKD